MSVCSYDKMCEMSILLGFEDCECSNRVGLVAPCLDFDALFVERLVKGWMITASERRVRAHIALVVTNSRKEPAALEYTKCM